MIATHKILTQDDGWNRGARAIESAPLHPPGPPAPEECDRHAAMAWHDGTAGRFGFAAWYPNPGDDRLPCVVSRGRWYGWDVFVWGSSAAEEPGDVMRGMCRHTDNLYDLNIIEADGAKAVMKLEVSLASRLYGEMERRVRDAELRFMAAFCKQAGIEEWPMLTEDECESIMLGKRYQRT